MLGATPAAPSLTPGLDPRYPYPLRPVIAARGMPIGIGFSFGDHTRSRVVGIFRTLYLAANMDPRVKREGDSGVGVPP